MNAIITIFEKELEALKDYSLVEDVKKLAGRKFYIGRLNEQNIVFTHTESNQLDLAVTTQIMIDHFAPERVFFTGKAAPLAPYIKTGDIIIANYFVRPGSPAANQNEIFEPDQKLLHNLRTVCDIPREGRPPHIFGTILDFDAMEPDDPRTKMALQEYGALATDRVGAAFGYVCRENGIPFVAIEIIGGESDEEKQQSDNIINLSIKEAFEIKGMALVEMTISLVTSQL
jgi:adenosylhomocysteine nucleosidase